MNEQLNAKPQRKSFLKSHYFTSINKFKFGKTKSTNFILFNQQFHQEKKKSKKFNYMVASLTRLKNLNYADLRLKKFLCQ